jgi:hypothetical protein
MLGDRKIEVDLTPDTDPKNQATPYGYHIMECIGVYWINMGICGWGATPKEAFEKGLKHLQYEEELKASKCPRISLDTILKDGRKVRVVSEIDGYKPLAVEIYFQGEEIVVSEEEEMMLYEKVCQKQQEKMTCAGS